MKYTSSILSLIILAACSNEPSGVDLEAKENTQIWKQVALRYPATGEMIPVTGPEAIQLKISGEEILMVTDSSQCTGKISDSTLSFDFSCANISPSWIIVEQTKEQMFIYPRLGAMYYYDYVMERVVDTDCLTSPRCDLVPETGPCKAIFYKYYFDKAAGKCKEFIWGGCDGVVPFNTLEECKLCECHGDQEGE